MLLLRIACPGGPNIKVVRKVRFAFPTRPPPINQHPLTPAPQVIRSLRVKEVIAGDALEGIEDCLAHRDNKGASPHVDTGHKRDIPPAKRHKRLREHDWAADPSGNSRSGIESKGTPAILPPPLRLTPHRQRLTLTKHKSPASTSPDIPMRQLRSRPRRPAVAAEEAGEPAPATAERSVFRLKLMGFEMTSKAKVIKEVKSMLGLSPLWTARSSYRARPSRCGRLWPKDESKKIMETMKGLGAAIVME